MRHGNLLDSADLWLRRLARRRREETCEKSVKNYANLANFPKKRVFLPTVRRRDAGKARFACSIDPDAPSIARGASAKSFITTDGFIIATGVVTVNELRLVTPSDRPPRNGHR